ncbi:MAG: Ig-like domain-containing protein [Bacteroidales bacterium]|nr:Ig-like domain-containing protein [Bacteroidales bacterium]
MHYRKLFMLAALLLAATCTDPDIAVPDDSGKQTGPDDPKPTEAQITVASGYEAVFTDGISAPAEAKTYQVRFNATDNWSTSVSYTGPQDWLTLLPSRGSAGDVDMTVELLENRAEQARSCTVTITCGKVSKTVKVTQSGTKDEPGPDNPDQPIAVTGLSLNPKTLEMTKGSTATITAVVTPADATDYTVSWSTSDQTVATVDQQGNVEAVGTGKAEITAEITTPDIVFSATCNVTVTVPVEKITIFSGQLPDNYLVANDRTYEMKPGEQLTVWAEVWPEDASDATVSWSNSSPEVASFQDGTLTAIKAGRTTVTASAGGVSASFYVSVVEPVQDVTVKVSPKEMVLFVGEGLVLEGEASPSYIRLDFVKISDETVISFTSGNWVTGLKEGSAYIVAEGNDTRTGYYTHVTDTCFIKVVGRVETTAITLDRTELFLQAGESATLTATTTPAEASGHVRWGSSNEAVARVADGRVTAIANGVALIYASAGDATSVCTVTVSEPVAATSVTLDRTSVIIAKGKSLKLTATVGPNNATDKTVVWSSSDASVVSVDQTGVLTGIGAGKATVKAKAGSAEATCSVEVTESDIEGLDDGGETNW